MTYQFHKMLYIKNILPSMVICFNKSKPNVRLVSTFSKSRNGFDDYEKEKLTFDYTVPTYFNFAKDVIDVWSYKEKTQERKPHPPAFWFVSMKGSEVKWSFMDLSEKSKRAANVLCHSCDLNKGDNAVIVLPKIPEFWLLNIAAIRAGIVLCPASTQLTSKDLQYRFRALKPKCIIADESMADKVDETCPDNMRKVLVSPSRKRRNGWLNFHELYQKASPDHKCVQTLSSDSMNIFFTSGTTGFPKMVEHTHFSYGYCLQYNGRYFLDLTSENVMWTISDTGWAKTAYSSIFGPWHHGSCVFIHEMPRFDPELLLQILCKYPVDTFCASATVYRMLVQEKSLRNKFHSLYHCASGGEPLNPDVCKQWKDATGLRIYLGYGQTETVMLTGAYRCLKYKLGSCGKPSPGINMVILDSNGNELGPNETGEIAVKREPDIPIGLFKGYRKVGDDTVTSFADNYHRTGDLGYFDEEGYLWIVSRDDDLINSAGYRIGPYEVESALIEHPAVVDVAVVSSPDETRGEVVKAFVVLTNDALNNKTKEELVKELQEHAKKVTAPYKYPRKIEFINELPKTVSGKISRRTLKDKEWNA